MIKSTANTLVPESERLSFVDKLFGIAYLLRLEPTVFSMAERICPKYHGGYWHFHSLSHGGFYMAPRTDTIFAVSCENGYEGRLSADALGIVACLYAFSHLSFVAEGPFAETCSGQYHLLREFAMEHAEARAILRATD